ncbi:MAG: bifunctional phosphoribosylaminoimidazolecarboxamide formyltransferase/IMP cyclohydrolase [Elusimicrobiota bacterium]
MKAVISVYNKDGIVEFAGELKKLGWDIISTGGTYKAIKNAGIDVEKVSDFTGSSEILGGRVKTLHPAIFAGILARDDQSGELEEAGMKRIDLVCCNLYPFEEAVEKYSDESLILENIDIGGVTLLRAAAKNYRSVICITDPDDYPSLIKKLKTGGIDEKDRKLYGLKAFKTTARYDSAIRDYFAGKSGIGDLNISLPMTIELRYGENSHQKAELYGEVPFRMIQGEKELSFNNIQDSNAAMKIVKDFEEPAVVIIKHAVPCGAAVSKDIVTAYKKALESDPMSAFGGIVGLNRKLEKDLAEELTKNFYEVIIAPGFSGESLEVLKAKPNLRVVEYADSDDERDIRNVSGGLLVQDPDTFTGEDWKVVTSQSPDGSRMDELKFAWKLARYLKSNAIVIAKEKQTYGLGSGETSRVGAVKVAVSKIEEFFPGSAQDLVMASDAFFPFPDAVEEAARAGVCAIVQPGGSKNDDKVIEKADELGIIMVFTGRRHFLH